MKKIILIFCVVFLYTGVLFGQSGQNTTQGKEFWVSFGQNHTRTVQSNAYLSVRIVATSDTKVTFNFTELGKTETVSIAEGSVYTRPLSVTEAAAVYSNATGISSKSLYITGDDYFSVFVVNFSESTTDATNVLPTTSLGTSYYHLSYQNLASSGVGDGYTVVATENNTIVYQNGTQVASLNKGQVYSRYFGVTDQTGLHITSNHPIAYYVTNSCVQVPNGTGACDCLYQQLPPASSWGNTFLVPVSHRGFERVRILASQNNTVITQIGGTLQSSPGKGSLTLNAGEFAELEVSLANKGCYISADKPVAVTSYLMGTNWSALIDKTGDPAMAWVTPIEQTVSELAIAPFVSSTATKITVHYVLLVAETAHKNQTTMRIGNGEFTSLSGGSWVDHSSGYSFYSLPLTNTSATYVFANPEGITALGYELGSAESYYYLAASSSRKLDAAYYINDIHYGDYDGEIFCGSTGPYAMKAVIQYPLDTNVGYLRWYVNGVEQTAAQDQLEWTLNSLTPNVENTITLRVRNEYLEEEDLSTSFTVSGAETPVITHSGVQYLFEGNYITLTSTPEDTYQWYRDEILIPGATSQTYDAYQEGSYAVKVKSIAGCESDFSVPVVLSFYPDNISEADCFITPDAQVWTIDRLYQTTETVFDMDVPLVADIDGNGNMVIVTSAPNYSLAGGGTWVSTEILVFDALTGNVVNKLSNLPVFCPGSGTRAIADVDNDGVVDIIVATGGYNEAETGYLICYNLRTGQRKWRSSMKYTDDVFCRSGANIMITDFNGDGIPEVLALDKVFNARTGELLLDMNLDAQGLSFGYGSGHIIDGGNGCGQSKPYLPAAADMDGDGLPEMIAGNYIYKINITNPAGTANNSWSILRQAAARADVGDGFTAVADIDLDGYLDVIVTRNSNNIGYMYAWNGQTGEIINKSSIEISNGINYGPSIPFVGDIDGDGYPEIALTTANKTLAYRYNPGTKDISKFWELATNDGSASTTLTMFDFNQDGMVELVYRDEANLRIMNGSLKSHFTGNDTIVYDLSKIPCSSWTMNEYPVVADVTGDGEANIIVLGKDVFVGNGTGYLNVYKSAAGTAWAPARKVWNQYAYNAVNINEDLTVPRYQMNPATLFPGREGQGIRPYNGFLMQQTVLSTEGEPLFLTPNAVIKDSVELRFHYDNLTDVLTVSKLFVGNVGDAPLNAPVKITAYKNQVAENALKYTYNHLTSIGVGQTEEISFTIADFSTWLPVEKLVIRVNDDGSGFSYQPVCDSCCVDNPNESFADLRIDSLAWADKYRNCEGDAVTFNTIEFDAASYTWYRPAGTKLAEVKTYTYSPLALADSGRYVFEGVEINNHLTVRYTIPYLSVASSLMYWRQDAEDSNWNNIRNWALDAAGNPLYAVPSVCTEVHIPGIAAFYPSLNPAVTDYNLYGDPTVNHIVYHYGAETAWPHKLVYNRASIEYNFGYYNGSGLTPGAQPTLNSDNGLSAMLSRNQWHLLAAPLKKVASGDFSLAGYPFTWQQLFNTTHPETGNLITGEFTTPFSSNAVALDETNHALAIRVAPYNTMTGYADHTNLEGLGGIIRLPYFDNAALSQYYPGHSYNKLRKESSFYYYDASTLLTLPETPGTLVRGEEGYRFVFEDENNEVVDITIQGQTVPGYGIPVKVSNTTDRRVMVGNPFPASLNSRLFYEANSSLLNEGAGYEIFTGSWQPYPYLSTHSISSQSAFLVTLADGVDEGILYFPLEGNYALTGTAGMAGYISPLDMSASLRIQLQETKGENTSLTDAVLYFPVSGEDVGNQADVLKLIYPDTPSVSEVFIVSGDRYYKRQQSYANGTVELGLGIRSSASGEELVLNFENALAFDASASVKTILVDRLLNVEQDVAENPVYRFVQTATEESMDYSDVSRFRLRFMKDIKSIGQEDAVDENLSVTYIQNRLLVVASYELFTVEVYDVNGRVQHVSGELGRVRTEYSKDLDIPAGVYLVKVKGTGEQSTVKKLIVQ